MKISSIIFIFIYIIFIIIRDCGLCFFYCETAFHMCHCKNVKKSDALLLCCCLRVWLMRLVYCSRAVYSICLLRQGDRKWGGWLWRKSKCSVNVKYKACVTKTGLSVWSQWSLLFNGGLRELVIIQPAQEWSNVCPLTTVASTRLLLWKRVELNTGVCFALPRAERLALLSWVLMLRCRSENGNRVKWTLITAAVQMSCSIRKKCNCVAVAWMPLMMMLCNNLNT